MYQEFLPYINVDEGLSRLMNMKKLYVKLLKSFLDSTNIDSIAGLCNAVKDGGDRDAARGAVHALKGVAANLSINDCYQCAANLEKYIKEGQPFETFQPLIAQLYDSYTNSVPLIQKLIQVLEQD